MKLKNSEIAKKMDESTNLDKKDTISYKTSLINSTIRNITEKLDILGCKI